MSLPPSAELNENDTLVLAEGDARRVLAPSVATVDRYVVLDTAGRGGMGVVLRAYDPKLERTVAIKLLRTAAGATAESAQRLLREAQSLAKLSHPNVLAVFDAGEHGEYVFLATEYVEGETLRAWLRHGPRSQAQILDMFLQAGEGLAAAHRAGMAHRDFKPDNVIVAKDGRVRVIDFGLARSVGDEPKDPSGDGHASLDGERAASSTAAVVAPAMLADSSTSMPHVDAENVRTPATEAGALMGTPPYMALEQLDGRAGDHRSDQYAFCVSLFEGLLGQRPFRGTTVAELRITLRTKKPRQPKDRRMAPWLRTVLERGLSSRPEDRYPTMDALLEALLEDPARRWRQGGAIALGMAAVAAVTFTIGSFRASEQKACSGATSRLAPVWAADVRAAVEETFRKSPLPSGARLAAALVPALDGYAARWERSFGEACWATRRGEQTTDVLTLRMTCLDERLSALRAFKEALEEGEPATLDHSLEAAAALPSIERCNDVKALTAPVPPPRDAAMAEEVRAITARFEATQLDITSDRQARAVETARELVARAERTGYGPVLARALTILGRGLEASGDHEHAAEAYARAAGVASGARDDDVAADALVQWVHVLGYWLSRHKEALSLIDLAEGVVQRTNSELLRAELDYALTLVYGEVGRFDDAQRVAEEGLSLRKKLHGAQHPLTASAHSALGHAYLWKGRFAEAEAEYTEGLHFFQELYGPRSRRAVGALQNLANVALSAGRHEEATKRWSEVLVIYDATLPKDHPYRAIALANEGLTLLHVGDYAKAEGDLREALRSYEGRYGASYAGLVEPLTTLARVLLAVHRPVEAQPLVERAIRLAEDAELSPPQRASSRLVLAECLVARNDPSLRARASALAEEARRGFGEDLSPDDRARFARVQAGADATTAPRR